MNITREDLPGREVALTIELDADTIKTALDRAYRQVVNQVNVPGFRRGKAPRYILESYVGREYLTEKAVRNILPETVQNAISEQDIEAMDVRDAEVVNLDPVQIRVVIVQPPVVDLGDYGDIRVEKEPAEIKAEQVDEVLLQLRRDGAPWNVPAEPRPIQEGDMVYVDVEGFTSAGELQEAKREDFPTLAGSDRGGVPPVVASALIGMKEGEEKDITDKLPEDYPNEELRGHDVSYHVTVRSMKEQQLPELDDEFAKKMEYDNVGALREAVEKNLQRRADEDVESKQVNAIIQQLVASSNVEVPEAMVDEELDAMLKRLEERMRSQRLSLRQYFTYTGTNDAEWREQNREQARERVIRSLVLHEFAHREGISVDEKDIDDEIEGVLEKYEGDERTQAESVLSRKETREELEDRLFQQKITGKLVAIAEGREQPAPAHDHDHDHEHGEAEAPTEAESEAPEAIAPATALEETGGAAELLGTGGVDAESGLETGDAPGGGTPVETPRLEETEKKD